MYSLSSQPFSKMCQSMPHIRPTSEPGRSCTCRSAWAAVRVKRGSHTIIFAPFSFARRMCCIATGWASAGFDPTKIIAFALCMSL